MNKDQLLELGIEIVSGMKASAYNAPIEDGRIMALSGTEKDRIEDDFDSMDHDLQKFVIEDCKREKKRLHEQAFFITDITIKKLEMMGYKLVKQEK